MAALHPSPKPLACMQRDCMIVSCVELGGGGVEGGVEGGGGIQSMLRS